MALRVATLPAAERRATHLFFRLGGGGPLDPRITCLGLILLLASGIALNVPQPWVAALLLVAHGALLLHSPSNGMILLFLVPPFFAGESGRAYFSVLELLVYSTLVAWMVLRWPRVRPIHVPGAPALIAVLAVTAAAVPLDLRELWLFLRTSSLEETWATLWLGSIHPPLNYLRVFLDLASGVGLFIAAVNEDWEKPLVRQLLEAVAFLYAVVALAGMGLYAGYAGGSGAYLSLSLVGRSGDDGFTAFAYNESYYGQYAVPYLLLAAAPVLVSGSRWARAVAGVATAIGIVGILLTLQRGAYLCLLLASFALLAASLWRRGQSRRFVLAGLAILVLIGLTAGLLVLTAGIGPTIVKRVSNLYDPARAHLWSVTFNMLKDQPLLGVGTGRFARFFADYSSIPPRAFVGWGTSHGLYSQILAEHGLLGLVAALWAGGLLVVRPLVALRARPVAGASVLLLFAVVIWLAYGLFQYTFYIRAMPLFFWIGLGIATAASVRRPVLSRWRARFLIPCLVLLLVLAAWRIEAALSRPLPPDFSRGMYRWERQPDGKPARWTQGRAYVNLRVAGSTLRLELAALFPGVENRPQTVHIRLDGVSAKVVELAHPRWTAVDIPVAKPLGSYVLLGIETRYTVVPNALGWGSDPRPLGVMTRPLDWQS